MNIRQVIVKVFQEILAEDNIESQEEIDDETVLLSSGLDSLGFAILVTRLELELGYDPFVLMDDPVYPRTFGEFVKFYESYKHHASNTNT